MNNNDLNFIFGEQGPLAKQIQSFAKRPQQLMMAEAVADTMTQQGQLLVEAGTGVGKTFAYLIPALQSGKKVIVATGTKNLQDQLFHRDIPLIRKALALPAKVALLKGRANYLCRYRLQLNQYDARFMTKQAVAEFDTITQWANATTAGDISEVSGVSEDSQAWSYVTSTADTCLGSECPLYNECFVVKARRKAQAADLLVINHHLFFADALMKESGFDEFLPKFDTVIFDEAHQLPDVASHFYGERWSSRQLFELSRDVQTELTELGNDMPELTLACEKLETMAKAFRKTLGDEGQRALWDRVADKSGVQTKLEKLVLQAKQLQLLLEQVSDRSLGLDNCWQRSAAQLELLKRLTQTSTEQEIHWFETFSKSVCLYLSPLNVSEYFQSTVNRAERSWIFTSATLAVAGNCDYFAKQLGLTQARSLCLDSPFDYQSQALFYLPRHLPDPAESNFTAELIAHVKPMIEAIGGRTFLLFTSYRALREAETLLQGKLSFPLLVQGSMPKNQLLQSFRDKGNAVLLGTSSFWEGVDVRGEALTCVVIDKLPFASPGDPLMQAKLDLINKAGRSAFNELQLPQAIIGLKQGVGRLIRDHQDRGLMILGDQRIMARAYGQLFLTSLPAMMRTRDLNKVDNFIKEL